METTLILAASSLLLGVVVIAALRLFSRYESELRKLGAEIALYGHGAAVAIIVGIGTAPSEPAGGVRHARILEILVLLSLQILVYFANLELSLHIGHSQEGSSSRSEKMGRPSSSAIEELQQFFGDLDRKSRVCFFISLVLSALPTAYLVWIEICHRLPQDTP